MSWSAFGMGALGTLVGNLSETYGTGNTLRQDKREEQLEDHAHMERQGIMSRVEGAKAAGLHPLIGAGANPSAGPSQIIGAQPIQSGYVDPPIDSPDPDIKRYNRARANMAELDYENALKNSRRALGTQPGQPTSTLPTHSDNFVSPGGRLKAGVKIIPDEVVAGVNGMTSGTHPGGSAVRFSSGGREFGLTIPSGKLAEGLEDQPTLKNVITMMMNRDRLADFVSSDIPWALRGYVGDFDKWAEQFRRRRAKPGASFRGRGSTGSW